jgi:hypothetical protein
VQSVVIFSLLYWCAFVPWTRDSWLTPKNLKKFSLKPVEEINYKLVDVQPTKAAIVNTQKPNARIEIGFAPP